MQKVFEPADPFSAALMPALTVGERFSLFYR
jgi:hypothetical protein